MFIGPLCDAAVGTRDTREVIETLQMTVENNKFSKLICR